MTTEILPPSIEYGLITGRFLRVVGDSADADEFPDGSPYTDLTISFTLSALKVQNRTDKLMFLRGNSIPCSTDAEGYLIDGQGQRGVYLVATDLPEAITNPVGSTYSVLIQQGQKILDQFSITVPAGSTQDLSEIAPIASSNGQAIVVGPPGEPDYEALAAIVEDGLSTHTPGASLGYVERTTTHFSTSTGYPGEVITGLSLTVVGTGRLVAVKFFCPSVMHTVANTVVTGNLRVNGDGVSSRSQICGVSSPKTTLGQGPPLVVEREMILADGVSYTFSIATFAYQVAGTAGLYALAPYTPMFLSVIAR